METNQFDDSRWISLCVMSAVPSETACFGLSVVF